MAMEPFQPRNGSLYCEDLSLKQLAREADTPLYVYSRSALQDAAPMARGRLCADLGAAERAP